MSKYSVLLVDDEEFVFEVMMKKMNWEEMGFKLDGYARNGLEALEMVDENLPDVVMTDIKMPYMDGLTLTRQLKEQYPNIKVIIFSGFDDFEFAKEAIKLEAEEYILKPIDAEELKNVFERVRNNLDREINERRSIDKLQEYYLNSLPMLQDNFYISLLEGRIAEAQISKYASDYQLTLEGPMFLACVFHVSYQEKNGEEMEIAPFMLSISVQKLVEEQMDGKWNAKLLPYLGDFVAVVQMENSADMNHFTDHMDRICKMAKRVCKACVTAGIGYLVPSPAEIRYSYSGAKNAISHRVLVGNMKAINIQEIEANKSLVKCPDIYSPHNIVKTLRLGDREAMEEAIKIFCDGLQQEGITMRDYRIRMTKLSIDLMEFVEQYELENESKEDEDKEAGVLELAYAQESAEDLYNYLKGECSKIMDMLSEKRCDSRTSFVIRAEDYVKENYSNPDLDIDLICSYLNVSSSYFSTAFKKDTGKTFINYLTDYRMDQALRLLDTTENKTYEIAEQIGYSDPNYFSYAFKKKFGISPSKYKKQSS